jgi:hypothetical protein
MVLFYGPDRFYLDCERDRSESLFPKSGFLFLEVDLGLVFTKLSGRDT